MPFFWNVIVKQGQLYGNRNLNNKVNVKNPYKISYPGYNELLSGYADPLPIMNAPVNNRNKTILEYFNNKAEYRGQVAAFSSWYIFSFLLNTKEAACHLIVVMMHGMKLVQTAKGRSAKFNCPYKTYPGQDMTSLRF